MRFLRSLFLITMFLGLPGTALAGNAPSPALMGALGLNTIPSARMDKAGIVRFHLSAADPYAHAALGVQLAPPLYIALRQTAQASSLTGGADRLLPGIDLRLRLARESATMPEITLGLQSAVGHKRMAGEYLVFSKRYNAFDFTGGIGWGRLGSAGHIPNPLSLISDHFGKGRPTDGEMPNGPEDWFTGESIGLFGGVEYFTPYDGWSIKADWGADKYRAEEALNVYDHGQPWSLGVNFAPAGWLNLGAALIGGKTLMASLSLQDPMPRWPGQAKENTGPPYMRPYRTGPALSGEMALAAGRDGIHLYDTGRDTHSARARLLLSPDAPTPRQLGRAARHMANHGGETTEALRITPVSYGLEGQQVTLMRRDLEQAIIRKQGSPQEIWRNASFDGVAQEKGLFRDRFDGLTLDRLRLVLDNQVSLSEEDSGLLYRTGLVLEEEQKLTEHFWTGASLRLGLAHNLEHLREIRPRALLPVRSDVDEFADRRLSLGRSFLSWMTTIRPDLHVSVKAGMLEEMYAGAGGEILYRPFGKTFAIGAEAWEVFKRDPAAALNLGLNGDHLLTGHLQAWYEFPDSNLTLQARIGRYLAEDLGGTLALSRTFNNGARLEAFITATDAADLDPFGGATHVYSGLKLAVPIGNIPHFPDGSEIRVSAVPFGRDAGQALDVPLPLYKVSEPLSYRHIVEHWHSIVN